MTVRVLHLAPHFGGGVGTVIRALVVESHRQGGYSHGLASLEPVSSRMADWANHEGVAMADNLFQDDETLCQLLAGADVVHLHWWHHPLLNAFMHRQDLPLFRCVMWTHVNGHYPPQNFPRNLADYPDILVLATPWSLKVAAIVESTAGGKDVRVIQSSAGVPGMPERPVREDNVFRVGYVGTVDTIKMHPDFIPLCLDADLPNAKFIVAGGPEHESLRTAVKASGFPEKFEILGPIDDVPNLMASLDVFGYPLNPQHYGTGEQVLLEAMAAGAVPVVLSGGCEEHVVDDGISGIVCADGAAYSRALRDLQLDRDRRRQLSKQSREAVFQCYSIAETTASWHSLYDEASTFPLREREMALTKEEGYLTVPANLLLSAMEGTPVAELFGKIMIDERTDSIGPIRATLPIGCFSETRGSPFHYFRFFPEDVNLAHLCQYLRSPVMSGRNSFSWR